MVWYAANHPELHLSHLEERMRQSGHWKGDSPLTPELFSIAMNKVIENLDVEQARKEVELFVKNPEVLMLWSHDFFHDVALRIQPV
jgi:hypothetical protein